MTTSQVLITALGASLIVAINWWFFAARRRLAVPVQASRGGGVQEVTVTVHGGYEPDPIAVEAGRPVRINFHRTETSGCSEEVVLGDFGIRTFLPAHEVTPVEFTPRAPGRYSYTCGMGMLRGTLLVTPPGAAADD